MCDLFCRVITIYVYTAKVNGLLEHKALHICSLIILFTRLDTRLIRLQNVIWASMFRSIHLWHSHTFLLNTLKVVHKNVDCQTPHPHLWEYLKTVRA